MGLLIPRRLLLWAALAASLAALGWWLRLDAVADYKRAQAAAEARARIDAINEDRELRNEIERLDDCGLVNRWSRWLRDRDPGAGAAVLRCGTGEAAGGGDGALDGGQ